MANEICISAIGIISALGVNVQENLLCLLNGKTGMGPVSVLEVEDPIRFVAGEVKYTNQQLATMAGHADANHLPRAALLAMVAVKEALQNACLTDRELERTGIVLGNTVGGMDLTERFYHNKLAGNTFIKSHSVGYVTEQVAAYHGLKGFTTTISTACSSSANAIMTAARLIKHGRADRVIAGGCDALTRFTYHGFKSLMVVDHEICKPFDKNRKGMNLGEGAAVVVLERLDKALEQGRVPLAVLSGYANSNDAFHPTATSPEGNGPVRCMEQAIQKACLAKSDIDYINLHGTGTENNDATEMVALQRVFADKIPAFSSTKSYFGHTLGASGGVEAVVSILAIREQLLFPNLFFKEAMDEASQPPITSLTSYPVKHVLSNSFGFGGNCTSLVFSKI